MTAEFSPALTLILGAALLPLLPQRLRSAYAVLLPLLGLLHLSQLGLGEAGVVDFVGMELVTLRVDRWSLLFGSIFMVAATVAAIFAWHVRSAAQQVAGLVYAGSAIGAVFGGDLLTLFVFWELTAVSSVLLVWARGTRESYRAGMRYVIIQLLSGMLLLFGAVAVYQTSGSLRFGQIGLDGVGGWLIFMAFGIKCAFPLLHNWLADAYPQATDAGTVYLSAFTTKLAVYALARGFPGTELLIPIGTAMAAFPIFYALIENDLRRVLAYSLNSQLGFMVVGIGIGTELSLNGTAAHAVASIVYSALQFMAMGAVLHRVGTVKATELGGLSASMPWTAALCVVGAASISSLPLFSGFVTKSMIVSAAGGDGHLVAWVVLMLASVGAFVHSGLKVPYYAFFGPARGKRCAEAPVHMLIAMGLAAALCVGIGVYPDALYALLPYPVSYHPYSASHVLAQLQLLMFSVLAIAVLLRYRLYPVELRSLTLDFDWVYRRAGPALVERAGDGISALQRALGQAGSQAYDRVLHATLRLQGPDSRSARTWSIGRMALWVLVLLLGYLLLYYV